ncbi:MAG TPA: tRNA pseudouridine(55) synthase TruB [Candidatus Eisenbacteria bacterium]
MNSAPPASADSAVRGAAPALHGLIAIDKPAGVTSHDVAEEVGRRLRSRGPGHLGTLDPPATGLLVVMLGAATRCAPLWQGGEKTYEGTIRLGIVTDTQDTTGAVIERNPVRAGEEELRAAGAALVGELDQIPPMVSARRVKGERLYRIARRGEVVERAPRRVRVISWEWTEVALPDAGFRVRCTGGTYVRTLAHDLGRSLGCGAALASLRRLRSEPFGLERALTLRQLAGLGPEEAWAGHGIPIAEALAGLPHVCLDDAGAEAVGHGAVAPVADAAAEGAPVRAGPRSVVLRAPDGTPLALGELERAPGEPATFRVSPHVVFPWAVRQGR